MGKTNNIFTAKERGRIAKELGLLVRTNAFIVDSSSVSDKKFLEMCLLMLEGDGFFQALNSARGKRGAVGQYR